MPQALTEKDIDAFCRLMWAELEPVEERVNALHDEMSTRFDAVFKELESQEHD